MKNVNVYTPSHTGKSLVKPKLTKPEVIVMPMVPLSRVETFSSKELDERRKNDWTQSKRVLQNLSIFAERKNTVVLEG